MSEWVIPVEQETGIPLAIEPNKDGLPPVGLTNNGADWHHAVFPSSRKELLTESGFVLAQSRVEWVDYDDHRSYHHYFDNYMVNRWEFPKTNTERFGMVVLLAAHYLPEQAIRITRSGPEYVKLNEYDRNKMWTNGILRIAGESKVYEFVKNYVLEQEVESIIDKSDIEEFVYTSDDMKRNEIGNVLLEFAAEMATDSIKPVYLKAFKNNLLTPGIPKDPSSLIIEAPIILGTEKRKRKARTALRNKFILKLGLDLPRVA